MKVQYEEIQLTLVMFSTQDVLTMSGFDGGDHGFQNPNSTEESTVNFE